MTTTPSTPADVLSQFTWHRQPAAEQLVREIVADFLAYCPEAAALAERMKIETGTRFADWIDYIEIPERSPFAARVVTAGYVEKPEWSRHATAWSHQTGCPIPSAHLVPCFVHPGGVFPLINITTDTNASDVEIGIKVDSVADFAVANGVFLVTDAEPLSPVRRLSIAARDEATFYAVERHGCRGMNRTVVSSDRMPTETLAVLERFRCRRADLAETVDVEAFDNAAREIDHAIERVGQDAACDLFFTAEREYWQRRNRAAQFQKARQDKLGLGWANHDHHTYRSSRKHFPRLIDLWEKLGFQLRERFYAGAEAGWGAQVAEHPNTGIVTFNDVDLSPEELMHDFSHNPLPERQHLGTVGLWCALHGESFLQAGMHHLECQFDFDSLRDQMQQAGIKTMNPFTDFPHLRQAFTEGERWPVGESRIARLLEKNQITPDQAEKFCRDGTLGSHLENLERNEGFKGFNQKGVSDIISKTDPRKQH